MNKTSFYYLKGMIIKEFNGFCRDVLPDVRIAKRAEKVMSDMFTLGKATVNKFCMTNTEKIGAYRMFSNNCFTYKDLIKALSNQCASNQNAAHLLCIQDTTEFNFIHHLGRIGKSDKDVGPVTKNDNGGFFCHPMLVLDAKDKMPLGIADVKIWNRSWDKANKHERAYKEQSISQKESFRWIETAQTSRKVLAQTPMVTIVGDRKSDIYEELCSLPDEQTHLLIRSSINRRLACSDEKLFEKLEQQELQSTYNLEVKGNKKRKSRTVRMELRYVKVKIKKPRKSHMGDFPDHVELFAIEARETKSIPKGESSIIWRLLTTHPINCTADAMQCLEWYANRWYIEELFRILKSKGFELEASQLETGAALKKQVVMALQVALISMSLKLSLNKKEIIEAKSAFSPQQIEFIEILLKTEIEGKTKKQKNPYPEKSLAWAAWAIARLSGWSGYKSHGPPGYISIKNGLNVFLSKFEGFQIALKYLNR
nr:IS4 family transposase [uncultured Draconibacterium sp.]